MSDQIIQLFHGTTAESAEVLLTKGWQPHSGEMGGHCGNIAYLYLTTTYENAMWYAGEKGSDVVLLVEVPMSELLVDPEDGVAKTVEDELSSDMPGNVVATTYIEATMFSKPTLDFEMAPSSGPGM